MPKCTECEFPLVCNDCGHTYRIGSQREYEAFFDHLEPVYCPECHHLLVCRYCGHSYDSDQQEYQPEARR